MTYPLNKADAYECDDKKDVTDDEGGHVVGAAGHLSYLVHQYANLSTILFVKSANCNI